MRRFFSVILVTLWPWMYLSRYVFGRIHAENDFYVLYYLYKAYLLDYWTFFEKIPLWSPSEGLGYPFFANPFAQVLYPLNVPLQRWMEATYGYSELEYHWYAIFGLSIFSTGMYLWLRSRGLSRAFACVAALFSIMCFKTTELMRFPNAIHTAAWYPWILLGLTGVFRWAPDLKAHWKKTTLAAFGLFLSVDLLGTGGYPYYFIYLPFLLVPYVVLLVLELRSAHPTEWKKRLLSPLLVSGSAMVLAVAAILPYFVLIKEALSFTVDRGAPTLDYAAQGGFSPLNTLGAWIYPPASMNEGWYYIGFLPACVLIWAIVWQRRSFPSHFLSVFLLTLLAITVFTWTQALPVFEWVRAIVPPFQSLRYWSRLNIVLVPWILLAFGYALNAFVMRVRDDRSLPKRWGALAFVLISIQVFLYFVGMRDSSWSAYFLNSNGPTPFKEWAKDGFFPVTSVIGAIVLFTVVKLKFSVRVVLLTLVAISFVQLYPVGAHQWAVQGVASIWRGARWVQSSISLTFKYPRKLDQISIAKPGSGDFGVSTFENWGYNAHVTQLKRWVKDLSGSRREDVSESEWNAFSRLYGFSDSAERFFYFSELGHPTAAAAMADHDRSSTGFFKRVIQFDGDRLEIEVSVEKAGFFVYMDNWDPNWVARVNDKEMPLLKYQGAYKALKLEPGQWKIQLSYEPFGPEGLTLKGYFGSLFKKRGLSRSE